MGFTKKFKKYASDVGRFTIGASTFGASELARNDVREKLGLEAGPLPQLPYESQSPYAPGAQWDPTGRPIGQMPRGKYALDWQYEADRRTEERRNALWGDAQNRLQQGLDLLQSYRPGGSAALASGMFQQGANLYGQQALNQESPDLLMGYREHQRELADRERKQAERLNRTLSIVQAGATILGGMAGGAGGAIAANQGVKALGAQAPGSITEPGGSGASEDTPQEAGPGAASGLEPIMVPPQQQPGLLGGPMPQGYAGSTFQGGAAPGIGQQQGPPAPPGGPQPGGPGAAGPGEEEGREDEPAGQQQGDGMGAMLDAGPAPLTMFTSQEAATNSMVRSRAGTEQAYENFVQSEQRIQATYLMMASARQELLEAMSAG